MQLDSMRSKAEEEKLRNEIYLYQNRKWYTELMGKVADQSNDDQHDLLRIIREMVEEGVVFNKATVRELVVQCKSLGHLGEQFVTKAIQDVFDFLCAQFGVLGEEYDGWVEDAELALPPSTLARYEAARQKRINLFRRDIVAKHWRQRFDMMATTKPLDNWLPHDVVDTVRLAHLLRDVATSIAPILLGPPLYCCQAKECRSVTYQVSKIWHVVSRSGPCAT